MENETELLTNERRLNTSQWSAETYVSLPITFSYNFNSFELNFDVRSLLFSEAMQKKYDNVHTASFIIGAGEVFSTDMNKISIYGYHVWIQNCDSASVLEISKKRLP
jgi:hypothetical protein